MSDKSLKSTIFVSQKRKFHPVNAWLKVLSICGILVLGSCSESASTEGSTPEAVADTLSSSSSRTPKENSTRGEIYIAVDESLRPIITAEIKTFMAIHPEAIIHPVFLPGEEAVARMIESDSIRLAITTRSLTKAEDGVMRDRLISTDYGVMGYDGIALVVHEDNPVSEWTEEQLRAVLTGKTTRWSDLSPEGTSKAIQLVFDHPQSSVLRFLRDSVLAPAALTQERIFAQQSTPEMFRYVAQNPSAVGFGGVSWISDRDDADTDTLLAGLKIVKIQPTAMPETCFESDSAYFGPFQSYLFQKCYPLTRQIRSIRRESIYGLGAGFTAYVVGPKGQRIIHKAGLVAETNVPRQVQFPERPDSRSVQ